MLRVPRTAAQRFAAAAWAGWIGLGWLVRSLVFVSLLIGAMVPIYSDEVATHMSRARFLSDGWQVLNLYPQCSLRITQTLTTSLQPGAVLYSLVYGVESALALRLVGMSVAAVWLAVLWWWAGKLVDAPDARRSLRVTLLTASAIGSMPMIMILARPEQWQALCLLLFCLVPLHFTRRGEAAGVGLLKAIGLLLLLSTFLYAHPKSVFFVPLAPVSIWASMRYQHQGFRLLTLVLAIGLVFDCVAPLLSSARCEAVPRIDAMLSASVLDWRSVSGLRELAKALLDNGIGALQAVPARVTFALEPQSQWLAPLPAGAGLSWTNRVIHAFYLGLFLASPMFMLASAGYALVRRQLRLEHWLGSALVAGLAVHAVVYNPAIWHFYTPGLVVPGLVILTGLCAFSVRGSLARRHAWIMPLAAGCALLFLASTWQLVGRQLPALLAAKRASGFTVPGQRLSTPVYQDAAQREALERLATSCRLTRAQSPHAVTDGVGYFYLLDSRAPMNALYVFDFPYGNTVADTRQFLRLMDSSGVLSRCDYLPESLRGLARVSGEMCCLSAEDFAE